MFPSCQKKFCPCPIPVNAQLRPDRHFGAISEKLTQQMESFVEKNPDYLAPTDEEYVCREPRLIAK